MKFDPKFDPKRLRRVRTLVGLSQVELSKRSGVRQDTISASETGKHVPHHRTLRKLADALGVEVGDFYTSPDLEGHVYGKDDFTVEGVREGYQPLADDLATYCARWEERLGNADHLSRQEVEELPLTVEEFALTAVNFKRYLLAARANEMVDLAKALARSGMPFSSETLDDLSVLRPAFERYQRLGHELVTRLPEQATGSLGREDLLAELGEGRALRAS